MIEVGDAAKGGQGGEVNDDDDEEEEDLRDDGKGTKKASTVVVVVPAVRAASNTSENDVANEENRGGRIDGECHIVWAYWIASFCSAAPEAHGSRWRYRPSTSMRRPLVVRLHPIGGCDEIILSATPTTEAPCLASEAGAAEAGEVEDDTTATNTPHPAGEGGGVVGAAAAAGGEGRRPSRA
jgi:hypothetical protein